jgi:hypothetical protein
MIRAQTNVKRSALKIENQVKTLGLMPLFAKSKVTLLLSKIVAKLGFEGVHLYDFESKTLNGVKL